RHRRRITRNVEGGFLPIPLVLLSMATIGPLVFWALWPWMWNDTLPRLQEYFDFHFHHVYYNIEFLGQNYFAPPSPKLYMPVMIAATVPTVTLVLWAIGSGERIAYQCRRIAAAVWPGKIQHEPTPADRERDRLETDLLLFLSFAVPLAV